MLAFVWTYDHILELIGVLIGTVAAGGGVIAAVFSVRGNHISHELATDEARRWSLEIRPGLNINLLDLDVRQGFLRASISNAGGAARPGAVIACDNGVAFGEVIQVGAHAAPQEFHLPQRYGFPLPDGRRVLLLVARDVEGSWWDIRADKKIEETVPDYSKPEFNEWCIARVRSDAAQ